MGIPRKGSRSVFGFDGKPYIFLVKQGRIPDHRDQPASVVVIQEDVEKPGRVLRASFFHGIEITPALVQSLVLEGKKLGWKPADRGAAIDLPPDPEMGRWVAGDPSSYD